MMACRALLRKKVISDHMSISTRYFFSGFNLGHCHSASVLLESRAFRTSTHAPFQARNTKKLPGSHSSGLFRSSYYNHLPSGHGIINPQFAFSLGPNTASLFIRHASTSTSDQAIIDSDDDDEHWVSIANRSKKSQDFAVRGLRSVCNTMLSIGRFLVAVRFMRRQDWAAWSEDLGLYVSCTFATYRLNITFFRANVSITRRLLLKLCRGKSLSRKERKLLSQTTAELFRLAPRATNILLPSVEFMLPLLLKLFPILPSASLQKMKQQEAARRKLKARIEWAKFLEDTAREMAQIVQNSQSGGIQQTAEEFSTFATRFLLARPVSDEMILRFAKLFNDDITLDNISRPRLINMCKCMGITPYGTDNFLRFMLRERLKSIKKGDELIQEKGVESLLEAELRRDCRERGIHAGEEMRQQLCDWLDLSLNHSIPSSLLILSREYTVTGRKPEEFLLDAMASLPHVVIQTVGSTSLPSRDRIRYKHRKFESLDLQEKQIKEERRELSKLKQSDTHTTQDDVALKEMTIPTANGPPGQARATAVNGQAQLCELSNANAILASALSLKMECENLWRLVNEEIYLCNSVQDNEGADGEKEAMSAQRGVREMNNKEAEVNVNIKVSSLLRNRADAMFRKIDDVDAKIDERWRDLDRYCDGKVSLEVVAAAALYLKDAFDKEEIQELMCNHSKYKEEIVKLGIGAEDVGANDS